MQSINMITLFARASNPYTNKQIERRLKEEERARGSGRAKGKESRLASSPTGCNRTLPPNK
jgi:hypothetical protein